MREEKEAHYEVLRQQKIEREVEEQIEVLLGFRNYMEFHSSNLEFQRHYLD